MADREGRAREDRPPCPAPSPSCCRPPRARRTGGADPPGGPGPAHWPRSIRAGPRCWPPSTRTGPASGPRPPSRPRSATPASSTGSWTRAPSRGGARRRLRGTTLVVSGLWGAAALADPIPDYRLKMSARLDPLGRMATWWRPHLTAALADRLAGRVVWDLLPAEHAGGVGPGCGAVGPTDHGAVHHRRRPDRQPLEQAAEGGPGAPPRHHRPRRPRRAWPTSPTPPGTASTPSPPTWRPTRRSWSSATRADPAPVVPGCGRRRHRRRGTGSRGFDPGVDPCDSVQHGDSKGRVPRGGAEARRAPAAGRVRAGRPEVPNRSAEASSPEPAAA